MESKTYTQRWRSSPVTLKFSVKVVSCDTAVDEIYGNLTATGLNWRQIEGFYELGAGCVFGAPCETGHQMTHPLTRADGRDHSDQQRDHGELADLCPRELLQLRTGCNFSLQTLWVWLVSWGVMMSEHPALPKALERVSIFTTPVAKLLRSIPEIELNVLPQGWWVRLPGNLRVCWLCGSRGSRRQCINGAWRIHLLLSPLLLAELPMGSSKLQR